MNPLISLLQLVVLLAILVTVLYFLIQRREIKKVIQWMPPQPSPTPKNGKQRHTVYTTPSHPMQRLD